MNALIETAMDLNIFNEEKVQMQQDRDLILDMYQRVQRQHCLASMDSDLEAFSRNPTDGSFAVLAFQLAAFTKYLNEVFLSY